VSNEKAGISFAFTVLVRLSWQAFEFALCRFYMLPMELVPLCSIWFVWPFPDSLTQEKWNIFRSNRANKEEWLLPFLIPFPKFLHKWNLLERSRPMNRFVKMERQISVRPVRASKVGHLQRWSRIFRSDGTETDLSIWLPTEITVIFGIMVNTCSLHVLVHCSMASEVMESFPLFL